MQMQNVLTEFADRGDTRLYTLAGHSAMSPRQLQQSRKVPASQDANAQVTVAVVFGTTDATGKPLQNKVKISSHAAFPVAGKEADLDSAIAVFRDYVASDEFVSSIKTQNWLKGGAA